MLFPDATSRIKASKDVLVVILALISSISVAWSDISGLSNLIFQHTLAVLFLLWAVSVYWTLPRRKTRRSKGTNRNLQRYSAVALVTLVYALAGFWFIWETKFRHFNVLPNMRDPYAFDVPLTGGWVISAAKAADPTFRIEQFVLIKNQTTFIETDDAYDFSHNATDGTRIGRSFGMNPKWFNRGADGCMDGMYDIFADPLDGDMTTMQAFTYYLQKFGKTQLYPYLENIIINKSRRPDVEKRLYPSSGELQAMQADPTEPNGARYSAAIRNWIKYCVGIPYPVFRITVSNTDTTRALQLNSIDYVVDDIGGYGAAEPGLFEPIPSYIFPIDYKIGLQTNPVIDPIFRVAAGQTGSFNLIIFNDSDKMGLSWKMKVKLESNLGNAQTSQFQLMMAGRRTWNTVAFR